MRPFFLILGALVGLSLADGIHGQRNSRRQGRRGGRSGFARRGRQEAAPLGGYEAAPLDNYAADAGIDARSAELDALAANIPGVPGEDYPIYSEVPESGFVCDGQVDGGYYADPEAECQVFHICTSDGKGGLGKYSFLCPNGTIFNQNYFICDWWFNFDCEEAADLYSLNDDIANARDAASGADDAYGAPTEAPVPVYQAETRDNYAAADAPVDYAYEALPAADYALYEDYPEDSYAAPEETTLPAIEEVIEERLPTYEEEQPVYEAQADYNALAPPAAESEILEVVRSGRNRGQAGRRGRNGRRQGRTQGRRQGRQGRSQGRRSQGRRNGGRRNNRNNGRRSSFRG